MNEFDRENFDWFINASAREQKKFLQDAGIEDLVYMISLVRQGISELHEQELDVINNDVVAQNCEEANLVLKKFRLNK